MKIELQWDPAITSPVNTNIFRMQSIQKGPNEICSYFLLDFLLDCEYCMRMQENDQSELILPAQYVNFNVFYEFCRTLPFFEKRYN